VGTFTTLDDHDIATITAAFGLGPARRWRAIAAGTINSNFEVETASGRHFVRVNEGKAEADVEWEAALCVALAEAGVPVAAPRALADGSGARLLRHRGLLVSVFAWLPGFHLAPHQVGVEHAARLGEVLAQIHVAGLALPASVRRGSIYDHAHLHARFAGFRTSTDPWLASAIATLADELAWLDAAAPVRVGATTGVIHGDLFRDNVLFDGERLVAVLDFEQASGGSLVYDLAVCINDWAWDGGARLDIARALVAGYQRVRPLTEGDRAALPIELRASAARFTITRITDVYLPGIANPDKDFRDFLRRLDRWRTGPLPDLAAPV
jgi:homoserine kinase type II